MAKTAAERQREKRKRDIVTPCNVTTNPEHVTKSPQIVTNTPESGPEVGQKLPKNAIPSESVRQSKFMGKVYNRPAISCSEFNTRPAPLQVTDTPVPRNRGRYTREDGSVYQFDCTGRVCVKSGPVDSVRIASIEDYHAHREDYAERACAELLNWGPWMNTSELKEARLSGNRGTLPGDWDYV